MTWVIKLSKKYFCKNKSKGTSYSQKGQYSITYSMIFLTLSLFSFHFHLVFFVLCKIGCYHVQLYSIFKSFSRPKSKEIPEILECATIDIHCMHETRFKEKSVRTLKGKSVQYKFFWIGNKVFKRSIYFLGWKMDW